MASYRTVITRSRYSTAQYCSRYRRRHAVPDNTPCANTSDTVKGNLYVVRLSRVDTLSTLGKLDAAALATHAPAVVAKSPKFRNLGACGW